MYEDISNTALSHLQDGEICNIVVGDKQHEAAWSVNNKGFYCRDGETKFINYKDVDEWAPASVRF